MLFTHLNGSIQAMKDDITNRTQDDRSAPTQQKRSLGPGSQAPIQAPSLNSCMSLGSPASSVKGLLRGNPVRFTELTDTKELRTKTVI